MLTALPVACYIHSVDRAWELVRMKDDVINAEMDVDNTNNGDSLVVPMRMTNLA